MELKLENTGTKYSYNRRMKAENTILPLITTAGFVSTYLAFATSISGQVLTSRHLPLGICHLAFATWHLRLKLAINKFSFFYL